MKKDSYYILLSYNETSPDEFRDYIRNAHPDMIELEALRGDGWAFFSSKVAAVSSRITGDPLATWAGICREEGVKVGMYVAVWACGDPLQTERWAEVDRDGNFKFAARCYNGSWADEYLIPFMLEIAERYSASHFWWDGSWIDREPCYCGHCKQKFQRNYGYPLPLSPEGMQRHDLLEFRETSMAEGFKHVIEAVKEKYPAVKIAANSAFYFKDLRKPVAVDWLSWDCINTADWRKVSFESTFLSTAGLPADIMIFENSRFYDKQNNYTPRFRPVAHLKSEASIILAHGLFYHLWQDPNPDGTMGRHKKRAAREIGEFVKERSDWCVGNESIAEVAIFASKKEHLLTSIVDGARHHWPGEFRIRGLHQILKEGHIPCEIIHDENLAERMERYRLIILPETTTIYEKTVNKLTSYVREKGGALLAVGEPVEELRKLTGVVSFSEEEGSVSSSHYDYDADLRETECEDGKVYLLPGSFISDYVSAEWNGSRDSVLNAVRKILAGSAQIEITAPSGVEVVINRKDDDVYIHFVNNVPGKIIHEEKERYLDEIVTLHDLDVKVRLTRKPKAICLMPSEQKIDFSYKSGYGCFSIPTLDYHLAARITL